MSARICTTAALVFAVLMSHSAIAQTRRQVGPAPAVGQAAVPNETADALCQVSQMQVPAAGGLRWQRVVDCEDAE